MWPFKWLSGHRSASLTLDFSLIFFDHEKCALTIAFHASCVNVSLFHGHQSTYLLRLSCILSDQSLFRLVSRSSDH